MHLFRTILSSMLLSVLLVPMALSQTDTESLPSQEAFHIRQARSELADAKEDLAAATNEVERAVCLTSVELAAQALTNYIEMAQLGSEEREFSSRIAVNTDYMLRKALGAIETETIRSENSIVESSRVIDDLKREREDLERRIVAMDTQGRGDAQKRRSIAVQCQVLNSRIIAQMHVQETEELRIRLAQEAGRIDEARSPLDIRGAVSVRKLHEQTRQVNLAKANANDFTITSQDIAARLKAADKASEIAHQRLAQIDSNISVLHEQAKVEAELGGIRGENKDRSILKKILRTKSDAQKRLSSLIDKAEDDRAHQEQRIELIDAQRLPLVEALDICGLAVALFEAESSYLSERTTMMKRRLFQHILLPFGIIFGLILGYLLLSHVIFPQFCKRETLFVARRLGGYTIALLIVGVLVGFFLEDLKAIVTILGIVGAAVIIALQDLCSGFAGWFVITASRKIRIGDRVEIDGIRGEVIDIQILRTTLVELHNWLGVDEPTGRTLILPNSFIFKSAVYNYSHVHPHIWGKIDITVTFETPYQEAYDMLMLCLSEENGEALEKAKRAGVLMERRYGTTYAVYEPRIHTVIADCGICFSLFYVCHYRRFSSTRDQISSRIAREFDKSETLHFAYPTERHIPTPAPDMILNQTS